MTAMCVYMLLGSLSFKYSISLYDQPYSNYKPMLDKRNEWTTNGITTKW